MTIKSFVSNSIDHLYYKMSWCPIISTFSSGLMAAKKITLFAKDKFNGVKKSKNLPNRVYSDAISKKELFFTSIPLINVIAFFVFRNKEKFEAQQIELKFPNFFKALDELSEKK